MFTKSDFTCEEWIEKVCSKGGTTEAALASYRSTLLGEDIITGANAALDRAIELGK